jgi:hypothetical protein
MMTTTAALEGCLVGSLVVIVATTTTTTTTTTTYGSEFVFSLFVGLRLVSLGFGLPLLTPLCPLPNFPALDDPSVPPDLSIPFGFWVQVGCRVRSGSF